MKRLDWIIILLFFGGIGISCDSGKSGRQRAHEKVVEEERARGTDMLGQDNGDYTEEIEMVAQDLQYIPNEISVDAGRRVRIQLTNKGDMEHNIEVELPTGEQELGQNLQPGEQGELEFTAPAERGTFVIYCPVDDHREKGMTAQLIVE